MTMTIRRHRETDCCCVLLQVFVAAHEIMHALGIYHEHMRPDRDQYITINYNNIPRQVAFNFHAVSAGEVTLHRKFDFKSIMLYDPLIFSANGRPTMTSKIAGQRMLRPHEKPVISDGDVLVINAMYKCPADRSNPIDKNRAVQPEPATQRPVTVTGPVGPAGPRRDTMEDMIRRLIESRRIGGGAFGRSIFDQQQQQDGADGPCPVGYAKFGARCIPLFDAFQ